MITTAIRPTIRPYSTAVAPFSSRMRSRATMARVSSVTKSLIMWLCSLVPAVRAGRMTGRRGCGSSIERSARRLEGSPPVRGSAVHPPGYAPALISRWGTGIRASEGRAGQARGQAEEGAEPERAQHRPPDAEEQHRRDDGDAEHHPPQGAGVRHLE